ncbi:hypothetical protein F5Y09DRAFT_347177 [Xylaria sp. FL1042]|nr:hypothetical protein F5Y09DRAFT_347177 [Xylaria sp. FL1042]
MLDQIVHVAKKIDTSLRRTDCSHASGVGVYLFLKDLLSTRSKAYDILCRRVKQTCEGKFSIGSAELYSLLDAIGGARLEADPSLVALRTIFREVANGGRTKAHKISELGPSIFKLHTLYSVDMDLLAKGFDNSDERVSKSIKKYPQGLKCIWDGISELCQRDSVFTSRESLMNPFIHEFYIREQDPLFHILSSIKIEGTEIDWTHIFKDSLGRTPLHYATGLLHSSRWTLRDWKTILRDFTCLLNKVDIFGRTPLHIACAVDCPDRSDFQLQVIEALLMAGARISIRDEYGLLAIEYAAFNNRADIVEIFQRIRNLDLRAMSLEMSYAQEALKKARDVAKAKMTGNDELDTETDSDSEESGSDTEASNGED